MTPTERQPLSDQAMRLLAATPRDEDGRWTGPPPASAYHRERLGVWPSDLARLEVIEAGAKAIGRAMVGQCFTSDQELARVAHKAMAPLIRRAVANQIAAELEQVARDVDEHSDAPEPPESNLLLRAAKLARVIGERHG